MTIPSPVLPGSRMSPSRGFGGPRDRKERLIHAALAFCAGVSALVTILTVLVLFTEALGFFTRVSVWEFLTETRWTPSFREKHFGILPLLSGSLLVAGVAGIVALPTGLLAAIFLSEHAGTGLRNLLKPLLEVLAGIPTVVYGYFAVTFVTPALRFLFPSAGIFNAASAGIVVGIMILPMVTSLSEDALRAVPRHLRDAAHALGATSTEVSIRVVVPAGASGILASFILALSRALGETMVVSMAAGNSPQMTLNPLESVQTMTAFILQGGLGAMSFGSLEYQTLFAVGMVLFLITMAMNLASQWVLARFRGGRP